jgi:hypothetical protein
MKKWLLLLIVFTFTSLSMYGQETNSISKLYENYSLKMKFDYWQGLEVSRNIDNKTYKAGIMGIDSDLYSLLTNSPSSKISLKDYNTDLIAGNILYWGGLAALCTDIVLVIAYPDFMVNTTGGLITYLSLLLGGATSSFVGIGVFYSGQNKVYDAIWQYNKDVINSSTKLGMNNNDIKFGLTFNSKF